VGFRALARPGSEVIQAGALVGALPAQVLIAYPFGGHGRYLVEFRRFHALAAAWADGDRLAGWAVMAVVDEQHTIFAGPFDGDEEGSPAQTVEFHVEFPMALSPSSAEEEKQKRSHFRITRWRDAFPTAKLTGAVTIAVFAAF
jgi:hypothetical protein